MDWQLQASLAKGISQETMTEVDIRASGKLHLLEKLLSELKNQKLKVLILFQVFNVDVLDLFSLCRTRYP